MQLDLDFIRSQFPAFSEPALAGQSFFENAGGSFTCRQVIDRLFRFYNERKVQPYAPYDASRLGGEEMDEARRRLSAMMGVHEDELSFGPSTTQNVYVLAKAFGEWMNEGDAIIVTNPDDFRDHAVPMITLATAHPAKFPAAVKNASEVNPSLPDRMSDLFDRSERISKVANDLGELKRFIKDRI